MVNQFDTFFKDKDYLAIKNNSFNYINRKNSIKKVYERYLNKKEVNNLDIGSGISPVSPDNKNTLFVDLSPDAVNFLQKKGFKAKVGNILNLKEKPKSYDFIFCSEVLEHIKNYKKALRELRRILKTEGILIITVPVHKKYWNIDDEFVGHVQRFEPGIFKESLEKSKLDIIEEIPIGSWLEKQFTILLVKVFKRDTVGKIGRIKSKFIILTNWILYFLVKISVLVSDKNRTSIMLYVCKTHQ